LVRLYSTGSLYNSTVSKTRDWAVMGAFEAEVFAREQVRPGQQHSCCVIH